MIDEVELVVDEEVEYVGVSVSVVGKELKWVRVSLSAGDEAVE